MAPRADMGASERFAWWAGLIAALFGGLALVGWVLDVDFLKRLLAAWPSMKPNTALGLVMAGASLATLSSVSPTPSRRATGLVLATAVGVLSGLTLAAYATGRDLGIDQLFYHEQPRDLDSAAPGRMAPVTAINFLLLCIALVALEWETRRRQRPAQYLALLGGSFCLVTLLGYLYSTPPSHRFAPFASVALHTAIALGLLWAGVLAARSSSGFMSEITSLAPGGALSRRLLPGAIAASALLGLLRVLGERAGLFGSEFGVALFATANVVVFSALVWEGARWLNRADADRRAAQRQQILSDERRKRFFEQNLAGACISRPDGKIVECNPAFVRIFGFDSAAEAAGIDIASLYPDPTQRTALAGRLREERHVRGLALEARRRDGQPVSLLADVVGEFDDSGDLVEICDYVQDVTEQRRVEMQLQRAQKMEAVGQLAGGIAHDFNNLLGVMVGYADLLLRDLGQGHPAERRIRMIQEAVDRAAGLTRQLLTFSRHQPVEARICDLNKAVEGIESMLRRLLGEDVRLVVALHHDIGQIRADVGQLEQVIVNLAVNARDATPAGGKLIIETDQVELDATYVRSHPEARAGPHVVLAVSDSGQGMDAVTVSRIFEPFFTTKASGKGTGLGLATVYGIVKRFGGHVAVYSELGRGSTFKVYFPSVRGEEEATGEEDAPAGAPPGGSEVVLVVEDEEALRAVITEVLRSKGYQVLEAGDADAALLAARGARSPVQLVVTDMVLPSRSGPWTAAEVQAQFPGVRVLYMSGYTDRAIADRGQLPAASHFLQKPFSGDTLLWRVRAVLDEGTGS